MMSNNPLISVVMPLYNAERFLEKSVKSVLNQTFGDFELIIIDDCSKDGSLNIAENLAESNERIRIIKNPQNKGVAETRNNGIREARGKYIALLDSDDIWEETKLEKQIKLLEKEKAQIAYCSYGFIDENDAPIKKPFIVPEYTNFNKMLKRSVISCSTALIEAELLKAHNFNAEFYHEDYVLWMELLKADAKAVGNTEVLAYYRQVSGSRSNDKRNAALYRWKIYRGALKLSFLKSCISFAQYAFYAVMKYYF